MKKMTSKQEQYYTKVMRTVSDVFKMMCNTNEPLPSVDEQEKIWLVYFLIAEISTKICQTGMYQM